MLVRVEVSIIDWDGDEVVMSQAERRVYSTAEKAAFENAAGVMVQMVDECSKDVNEQAARQFDLMEQHDG